MNYIGYIMMAMPFIVLFLVMWRESGIGIALQASGIVIGLAVWVCTAIYLTDPNGVTTAFWG